MANRYWVGGTNNWDSAAGTKWATTSGGTGGATVPSVADDVFFTNLSTGTCTIATGNPGAKSINCTGFTGTIAGTTNISVAGGITLSTGMTYTHSGTIRFSGSGTLITSGKLFSPFQVDNNSTLTLGDALNIGTRTINILSGTFTTANFNVTANDISSTSTTARTINLGSSTITLSTTTPINLQNTTNLTFNAGTSQLNLTSNTAQLRGGSQTFYNVSFTSVATGSRSITGANTFNNLTLNASATGLNQLSIDSDQTVNGTFTCDGVSGVQRGFVRSNFITAVRIITAANVSVNNCDFRNITIDGAAAPISPTNAGDCGGNSGITFPASKTVYRVGSNTSWNGVSSWATTANGTGSNDNFPLAQDIAVIDNFSTSASLSFDTTWNIGNVDYLARTNNLGLFYNSANNWHGNYTLSSVMSVSGIGTQTFVGRSTMTFTTAGKTITFPIIIDAISGSFELGDATTLSNSISLNSGTFDAKNYNFTCPTFASSNASVRTLTMGSGLWAISGSGGVWTTTTITNLTFNKDTANILLSGNNTLARTFSGGGLSYNKLTMGGDTGSSVTSISGINSFTELASTKTVAHTIRFTQPQGTIGVWSVTGTIGNVVTVDSSIAGTRRNFNLASVTTGINYLNVKDIGVTNADKFYVGSNSIDSGNNLNVYFTEAPPPTPGLSNGSFLMMF